MKSIITLLLISIVLMSCSQGDSKTVTDHSETSSTQETETKPQPPTSLNKDIVLGDYKGQIANKLNVQFHLENNDGQIAGFYFYEKIGIDIKLKGIVADNDLLLYELDYKDDTLAVLTGTIKDSAINGKWRDAKTQKEFPLNLKQAQEEIKPLTPEIAGKYYEENCGLTLSISKNKGEYYYDYASKERKLNGKVTFSRGMDFYLTLNGIEYAEDGGKKKGERQVGIECYYEAGELVLQNYGNAMNPYLKLYDCDEKYITFRKQ